MGVLLKIYCIFSEHLFLRTPLGGGGAASEGMKEVGANG